eukprot:ctg_988.g325
MAVRSCCGRLREQHTIRAADVCPAAAAGLAGGPVVGQLARSAQRAGGHTSGGAGGPARVLPAGAAGGGRRRQRRRRRRREEHGRLGAAGVACRVAVVATVAAPGTSARQPGQRVLFRARGALWPWRAAGILGQRAVDSDIGGVGYRTGHLNGERTASLCGGGRARVSSGQESRAGDAALERHATVGTRRLSDATAVGGGAGAVGGAGPERCGCVQYRASAAR